MYFTIAVRNLLQAKRRTLLLSLAIGAVTMLLVLLQSLSQGLNETMIQAATTLSAGHVNVAGFFKSKPSDASPILSDAPPLRAILEKETPGLDYVIDRARGWGKIISDSGSVQSGLTGVNLAEERTLTKIVQMARENEYRDNGRDQVLGDINKLAEPGQLMLFAAQARKLNVTVGDQVTISIETIDGQTNTMSGTVCAIARDIGFMSGWSVFLNRSSLKSLYEQADTSTGALMVYLKPGYRGREKEVMDSLRGILESKGYTMMDHDPNPFWMKFDKVLAEDWIGQQIDLTTWEDEVSFLKWVLVALDSITFFLIAVLTFVIAVGIMNTVLMSVRERTREIGTVRAIGLSQSGVLTMFLLESLLLGLFATALGSALGASIAWLIDSSKVAITDDAIKTFVMSDTLHLSVLPQHVITAIIAFTFITGLSALWPALRASRMQPVTAMSSAT
ncbi:MAG: hypothetical protein GMKNLPBB_02452 [Myxococcota bacterium]|nr:hypothetical protein [Myxococcota bacterium]